ncbi:MAG: hypothetical protein ACRCYX_16140 [Dermatophilaceae bacterium]
MPDPHVDEVSGICLVGGETRDTTDAPSRAPDASAEPDPPTALPHLADAVLAAAPDAPRVLLVGLPAAALAGRLGAAGAEVDVLVRSLDDARHQAAAIGSHAALLNGETCPDGVDPSLSTTAPNGPPTPRSAGPEDAGRAGSIRVLAGVVDRYSTDDRYDAVLAPGSPTDLRSPDSPDLGPRGLLADLGALVRPGGLLVASLPCPSGLDALLTLPSPRTGPAAWHRGAPGSREAPPSPEDAAHLTGMPLRAAYGAWPTASAPRLLVTAAVAGSARAAAAASWSGTIETLRDPGIATQRAADAGLLDALAPGRLVVLGGSEHTTLPAVLDTVPAESAAREPLHDALDAHDLAAIRTGARQFDDHALAAVAAEHHRRGLTTPWGVIDTVTLAGHLVAVAGRTPAGRTPAGRTPAGRTPGGSAPEATEATGDLRPGPPNATPVRAAVTPAVAEARVLVGELETAISERGAQVRWLEGMLRTREREIGVLERAIDVEKSSAYRALRQLARPVPAARRRARRVLDHLTGRR